MLDMFQRLHGKPHVWYSIEVPFMKLPRSRKKRTPQRRVYYHGQNRKRPRRQFCDHVPRGQQSRQVYSTSGRQDRQLAMAGRRNRVPPFECGDPKM